MMNLGVYIHIPFCIKKCNYCDFASFPLNDHSEYFKMLKKEILMYSDILKTKKIDTVFIGGGTPTVADYKYIGEILSLINLDKECEVTIEANPKTLTKEKLSAYKDYGINRISIGMQSANDNELKILGRIHNHYDFLKSYEMVTDCGFSNINVDTMFGIPYQTFDSFSHTMDEVKKLNPAHISSYSLIIEENTPFFTMDLSYPDEDVERRMFESLDEILSGYKRYEISNFSKPGYECKHNLKYWSMEDYLGFGLGAHSFFENKRWSNYSDLDSYILSLKMEKKPIFEENKEDNKELYKDYIITGLRKINGIKTDDLKNKYGIDLIKEKDKLIKEYIDSGYMKFNNNTLSFTKKGISVSNHILSNLI